MDDNVDVEFLRINSPGFKNAEDDLLASGWREKKSTRATTKDIQRAYFIYLVKAKAAELQRSLTRDEMFKLEKDALELKDTKMYVKSRASIAASMNTSKKYNEDERFMPEIKKLRKTMRPAAAASMNNSDENEEDKFMPEIKKLRNNIRPVAAAAGDERPAAAAAKINKIWGQIRSPPKARFPNVALNLPNNSDENYQNAMPLNNILSNFNKLNIGNRNRNRKTLKRKRSPSLSEQRKSRKRSRYMNAPLASRIGRFKRRGSKFSNLPSATRRKYMRRLSRKNK